MMMRSDRKPPLRRLQTKSVSMTKARLPKRSSNSEELELGPQHQKLSFSMTKSSLPKQSSNSEELELRPEYQTLSRELKELTKMVRENLWGSASKNHEGRELQRGRLYDEYSARRDERLKRKRGEPETENTTPSKLYVEVSTESTKKSTEVKKIESGRKIAAPLVERGQVAAAEATTGTRYSLRSRCKENKKPPLTVSFERSSVEKKKTAVRRSARKGY